MSTVQLNLLPDIKKEFIKAQRSKRLLITVSVIVVLACGGLVALMFSYTNVAQKLHIKNLQKDIDKNISTIRGTEDIEKILTVQNQLNALPGLHDQKPAITRVGQYLQVLVPGGVKLNELTVDFVAGTVTIKGESNDFKAINIFADTLKSAQYTNSEGGPKAAFNGVILQEISKQNGETAYAIVGNFDPAIFSETDDNLVFVVPNTVVGQPEANQSQGVFDEEATQ